MDKMTELYQTRCLEALKPIVGEGVEYLVKDNEGNFGLAFGNGRTLWIMADAEGNGPGFPRIEKRK